MTTRPTAALLLSSLALVACSFDGTGFGNQPDPTAASTTTGTTSSATTSEGVTSDPPTTGTTGTTTPGDGVCGDFFQDPGEECDSGVLGNAVCTPACKFNVCGDGHVGSGEACDSELPVCEDCQLASCGNGMVDDMEECDDGNDDNTDGCLNTCKLAACGDGVVQAGVEECDDGNSTNTDACLDTCVAATCGDAFVWEGVEFCDDGNDIDGDGCNSCAPPGCGDGVLTDPEECDDGNSMDGDGCSKSCKLEGCGDGVIQAPEECDDGMTQNDDEAACTADCTNNVCGDGKHQAGVEECDDGNDDDTDACTSACKDATCGDGFTGPGEECDDGDDVDTDACKSDCTENVCGDGILNEGVEVCDHGPLNASADPMKDGACKSDCTGRNGFLVFVTSATHHPDTDFDSVADADLLCAQAAASGANALKITSGNWKAWLHDGVTSPATSFHDSQIPYITLHAGAATTVADNRADLIDGTLTSPINVTDKDVLLANDGDDCDADKAVWTGTRTTNAAGAHCLAWTDATDAENGEAGTVRAADGKWTEACQLPCDQPARLYCFEQPSG